MHFGFLKNIKYLQVTPAKDKKIKKVKTNTNIKIPTGFMGWLSVNNTNNDSKKTKPINHKNLDKEQKTIPMNLRTLQKLNANDFWGKTKTCK